MSDTSLSESLYSQLNAKDTAELLAIWTRNDADECTPEELTVLSAILSERLGSLPSRSPATRRKHIKRPAAKKKTRARFTPGQIWSGAAGLIVFALLIEMTGKDRQIPTLVFLAASLLFLVPAFLIGRRAWFQSAQLKRVVSAIPAKDPADGRSLITRLVPEQDMPQYVVWLLRLISIALLAGGIIMIVYLFKLF
jgi:hypothetical protein